MEWLQSEEQDLPSLIRGEDTEPPPVAQHCKSHVCSIQPNTPVVCGVDFGPVECNNATMLVLEV